MNIGSLLESSIPTSLRSTDFTKISTHSGRAACWRWSALNPISKSSWRIAQKITTYSALYLRRLFGQSSIYTRMEFVTTISSRIIYSSSKTTSLNWATLGMLSTSPSRMPISRRSNGSRETRPSPAQRSFHKHSTCHQIKYLMNSKLIYLLLVWRSSSAYSIASPTRVWLIRVIKFLNMYTIRTGIASGMLINLHTSHEIRQEMPIWGLGSSKTSWKIWLPSIQQIVLPRSNLETTPGSRINQNTMPEIKFKGKSCRFITLFAS